MHPVPAPHVEHHVGRLQIVQIPPRPRRVDEVLRVDRIGRLAGPVDEADGEGLAAAVQQVKESHAAGHGVQPRRISAILSTDFPAPGTYQAEVEVTFPNGKVQTFPEDGYLAIRVVQDLG